MKNIWIEPYLREVLTRGAPILDHWRSHQPTLAGRVKNFENWLLVELVHHLLETGAAKSIRTNGTIDGVVIKPAPIAFRLHGRKAKSDTASPDLSVFTNTNEIIDIEIKTGTSGIDLLDDLELVKYYAGPMVGRNRPEFAWATLIPDKQDARKSVLKSIHNLVSKAKSAGFNIMLVDVQPWLHFAVWAPD